MKINKILNLFIVSLVLILSACDSTVDEETLGNTSTLDDVELTATQSTTGGNEITLDMTTPGVTGYWDYVIGKGLTDRTTFVFPVTGTFDFNFVGTLGSEFFEKSVSVTIDNLDTPVAPEWAALLGNDAVAGKTWVFDGTGGDDELWYFMSVPGDPESAFSVWWNAGGTCCPPPDVNGKMKFDLDGKPNFTYQSDPSADEETGLFVLNTDNMTLQIVGSNILGGADSGQGGYNPSAQYDIISLTETELILYYGAGQWGSGWTWVFRPE